MKTIVFFCIPAHGHTNPTLGVVRELVSRGHRVRYYSYEMLREKIEAAGAGSMAVWGKAAALKLGIPFVSSTTTFAFNRHSATLCPI